mmetsp:Transcript_21619/g.52575  ORF Transcript_21619/g.52575 Transcript_21619/m.52575 type:complete len:408 (-) Transcript_21619:44-1267(-)
MSATGRELARSQEKKTAAESVSKLCIYQYVTWFLWLSVILLVGVRLYENGENSTIKQVYAHASERTTVLKISDENASPVGVESSTSWGLGLFTNSLYKWCNADLPEVDRDPHMICDNLVQLGIALNLWKSPEEKPAKETQYVTEILPKIMTWDISLFFKTKWFLGLLLVLSGYIWWQILLVFKMPLDPTIKENVRNHYYDNILKDHWIDCAQFNREILFKAVSVGVILLIIGAVSLFCSLYRGETVQKWMQGNEFLTNFGWHFLSFSGGSFLYIYSYHSPIIAEDGFLHLSIIPMLFLIVLHLILQNGYSTHKEMHLIKELFWCLFDVLFMNSTNTWFNFQYNFRYAVEANLKWRRTWGKRYGNMGKTVEIEVRNLENWGRRYTVILGVFHAYSMLIFVEILFVLSQ